MPLFLIFNLIFLGNKHFICICHTVISASDYRYLVCGFDVHECPSLRLWRGVRILMIKDYQLNNIYLIKVRVQTLEHKRLLNIVSSQNTNGYSRINDTRQRNIRSRKTTLEWIQLMKSKIYLMKNVAFDHLVERWSKGMVKDLRRWPIGHLREQSSNTL